MKAARRDDLLWGLVDFLLFPYLHFSTICYCGGFNDGFQTASRQLIWSTLHRICLGNLVYFGVYCLFGGVNGIVDGCSGASAKRALERERTTVELAKRCLEEARSELKILGESGKGGNGGTRTTKNAIDDLRTKLKGAEEQLVLIRESNTMLWEESQKARKKLSEVQSQSQFNVLKTSTSPQMEKMKSVEVKRASLEAEKDSLLRDVESWKAVCTDFCLV